MLRKIVADTSFRPDKRDIADGLLDLFSTKQFIAGAYLFCEIFAITCPLSRILQSVNIDFGKALNLLDAALEQLTQLRDNPQSVIDAIEKDFAETECKEKRTGRRRQMPGKLAEDEPATSAEDKLRREVFYVAVDSVSTRITNRFSSSRHVFEAFAIFSPKAFPTFVEIYPTTVQVKENVIKFFEAYKIDPDRCATELLSFATVFKHFNLNLVERKSTDFDISEEEYSNSDSSEEEDEITKKSEDETFADCLSLLTDKRYHLVDAYLTLVNAYSIAMAIPITSCSAVVHFLP